MLRCAASFVTAAYETVRLIPQDLRALPPDLFAKPFRNCIFIKYGKGEDMTHSLHREGSLESLEREYVLFIYPARGFNYKGSAPKVRRMVELLYQAGPVNMIPTSLRRNMYSGVRPEEILESITVEGTRVYSVFNDREKLKKALILLKKADEGISVMVSGVTDRVREIASELGIEPHMVNL